MIQFVKRASGENTVKSQKLDLGGGDDRLYGVTCGNAGCDNYVFIQHKPGRFRYAGHEFFHSDGFKVIRSNDPDTLEILVYWRENAGRGYLIRYRSVGCGAWKELAKVEGESDVLFNFVKNFERPER